MTRITGHPDDDLLTEKGYSGHPTLAFMNPAGEVLGRPRDRSVESFEATLQAIYELEELERREAAGEKVSAYERFILEYSVMRLRGQSLVKGGRALTGLSEEEQAKVDSIVLMVEVGGLVLDSLGGPDAVKQAGERMLAILNSGKCPDMESDANVWSVLSRYGEAVEDADLLDRCSAGLAKYFPDDKGMTDWASSLAKKAAAIRGRSKRAFRFEPAR